MRQVYRLLGLVKRYGGTGWTPPAPAPWTSAMSSRSHQDRRHAGRRPPRTPRPRPPRAASGLAPARFARDPDDYRHRHHRPEWLYVIDGGSTDEQGQEGLLVTKPVKDVVRPDLGDLKQCDAPA